MAPSQVNLIEQCNACHYRHPLIASITHSTAHRLGNKDHFDTALIHSLPDLSSEAWISGADDVVLSATKVLVEIVALLVSADRDKNLNCIKIRYSLCNTGEFGRGTNQPTSALLC